MSTEPQIVAPNGFSWKHYGAYSAFDAFLADFIIARKSFISSKVELLDPESALNDIQKRFVDGFEKGEDNFGEKAAGQFKTASKNTKLFFANAEYLWAMPSCSLKPQSKRRYALRWFTESEIKDDADVYFNQDDGIANPGSWYQTNKYFELLALFRLLSYLFADKNLKTVDQVKARIEALCYEAIYGTPKPHGGFYVKNKCGVHAALLHLATPEKYESIISHNHKQKITNVFQHIIADRPDIKCREQKLRLIRSRLYDEYGASSDPSQKYRWFFYRDDVKRVWSNKNGAGAQKSASIKHEINDEENSPDLEDIEGHKTKETIYRVCRSAKLVAATKKRDKYTCLACEFHFDHQIVHVHHLDPLSERKSPKSTCLKDLVTLCPTCHYLAHYYLRKKPKTYKQRDALLQQLKKLDKVRRHEADTSFQNVT